MNDKPWWEIPDPGGFPPFWSYAIGKLTPDELSKGWPSDWDRRPHP